MPDNEYKAFLANWSNKQALINLLGEYMANVDITVQHAEGDSDYMICTVACRCYRRRYGYFSVKFAYHAQGRFRYCLSPVEAEPAICI